MDRPAAGHRAGRCAPVRGPGPPARDHLRRDLLREGRAGAAPLRLRAAGDRGGRRADPGAGRPMGPARHLHGHGGLRRASPRGQVGDRHRRVGIRRGPVRVALRRCRAGHAQRAHGCADHPPAHAVRRGRHDRRAARRPGRAAHRHEPVGAAGHEPDVPRPGGVRVPAARPRRCPPPGRGLAHPLARTTRSSSGPGSGCDRGGSPRGCRWGWRAGSSGAACGTSPSSGCSPSTGTCSCAASSGPRVPCVESWPAMRCRRSSASWGSGSWHTSRRGPDGWSPTAATTATGRRPIPAACRSSPMPCAHWPSTTVRRGRSTSASTPSTPTSPARGRGR